MTKQITHASVFSGIGAPEIAADMLGWKNLFHCEINQFGRAVLDHHYPNCVSYEDITKTDFSEWRGKVTVLTGGFPCQPFSYAGKRRGSEDDRYLWPSMCRCIEQVRPTWFVGENVGGLATMAFPGEVTEVGSSANLFEEGNTVYESRQNFVLDEIIKNLERIGYQVQPFLIPACAVGAPHRRDRIFIVAHLAESVADTDSGTDTCGESGVDEGEGGEERVQQPVEPVSVRREMERASSDSNSVGLDGRNNLQGCFGELQKGCSSDASEPSVRGDVLQGASTYTNSTRQSTSDKQSGRERAKMDGRCESESFDGVGGLGKSRSSSDTESEQSDRIQSCESETCEEEPLKFGGEGCGNGCETINADTDGSGLQEERAVKQAAMSAGGVAQFEDRWRNFPTQSPVHRRDDGLPFNVDSLAIPFTQWRKESLKAYGNAIVPQVMYEIFRGIEIIEKEL